jgi:hypothetical protein
VRARTPRRTGAARRCRRLAPRAVDRRASGGDRGQVALEYVGFLAFLLVAGLAAIQLGLAAYAVQQAGTGARAAARAAGYREAVANGVDPTAAGESAMSDWLHGQVAVGGEGSDSVTATATVPIPAIIPLFHLGSAVRSVTMPGDRSEPPGG